LLQNIWRVPLSTSSESSILRAAREPVASYSRSACLVQAICFALATSCPPYHAIIPPIIINAKPAPTPPPMFPLAIPPAIAPRPKKRTIRIPMISRAYPLDLRLIHSASVSNGIASLHGFRFLCCWEIHILCFPRQRINGCETRKMLVGPNSNRSKDPETDRTLTCLDCYGIVIGPHNPSVSKNPNLCDSRCGHRNLNRHFRACLVCLVRRLTELARGQSLNSARPINGFCNSRY